ncbi:hypothetical protein [Patiriisocius marinus]|uniref:Uncharacterized protein n=2 Tax=Patiriisocius marinus TaxID=1397112 RepID=A0A5J4ITV5_9FLAO|nr:hypothetical protein [Patiriisocius marinus]GER57986.1 hypothetical protein ULMA_00940 [Patiriisocius marinus]
MNSLFEIMEILSPEECNEFLLFLNKKNRRGDTKNQKLFKLLASGVSQDIDIKLYGEKSSNALHALSSRLHYSLIDFIASKSFQREASDELEIFKLILAARILFEHKKYKIAFKTLDKAEKQALELDLYSILTEIYHTKVQYAHLNKKASFTETINASNLNLKLFTQEQQLNMVYATIKRDLKKQEAISIEQIITSAFGAFDINLDASLSYKSLFQLLNISATASKLQSNFYESMPFMTQLYAIISEKEHQVDKHLFYHIEILNLMAIASFRNKKFKTSQHFTEKMEVEMAKQNNKYHTRFLEKLYLNKGLLLNYTNKPNEAIALLKGFTKQSLDIELTLVMCYFQQQEFNNAYYIIKSFNHSDAWYEKKNGWIWVVKKCIIEILVLIELDKLDLVLSRLKTFNIKYSKKLNSIGEHRVVRFIKLVAVYYESPKEVTSPKFHDIVEKSFEWIGTEKEDIFIMSFYAWLKSKMEGTNIYDTTLRLVTKQ